MRKIKTAMDVQIRQRKGPSFQNTDQQIRQAASLRIRGSFALREEVISELPERYRKTLMSMPPGQQEQILSAIERKIDRKISSVAMSAEAAKLSFPNQANSDRGGSSKQIEARRQAVAQKYRIPSRKVSAKIKPEMLPYGDIFVGGRYDSETWKTDLSGVPPDVRKRLIQKRLSQYQVEQTQSGQATTSKSRYMRTVLGAETARNQEILSEIDRVDSENSQLRRKSHIQEEAPKQNLIASQRIKKKSSGAPKELSTGEASSGRNNPGRADPRAGPAVNDISIISDINTDNISQSNDIFKTDDLIQSTGIESYEQFLMSSAKTRAQKAEIRKAIQKAVSGKSTRETRRVLQEATLRAAYAQRNVSGVYKELLAGAGFTEGSEKAEAQLAYQKQVRKVMKNEYRKQLTGKLSRLKTTSVMKKVQMQKARQEQFKEDEQNRAQSDQFRQSFGLMSKGTKMLKKLAEDARKAIKALLTKQLPLMIIPVLMAVIIPLAATIMPLFSALTATSYQDNEGYAYADATELIEYAKSWIGKIPYVWGGGHGGGPTAWQSGCDCSGFVHGVFNHFGYEIGGDTGAMETQAGTHIAYDSLAQAQPGDVLIYYRTAAHVKGDPNGNGSTHVAIYIGNNQIIHQSGGVHISNEYHQYLEVRRVLTPDVGGRGNIYGGLGGMGSYGHKTDATNYSQSDLELIWAIVAQEDNGSYKGALAVISAAMNRVESPKWGYEGKNALAQLTAPGQFCYSNDTYWQARLGGNVPDYVKQAVNDCLKKGKRNHNHTSFRSTKGKVTGDDAVQIGGNWFFDY